MTLAPGIRRLKTSYQVYTRIHGKFLSETYPLSLTLPELKRKRERLIAIHRHGAPGDVPAGKTFADDAREYLRLVADMPSFEDRAHRINKWASVFGTRDRTSLTAREIRATLNEWKLTGRVDGGPLAAASLNLLRTALMALYTALDGKSAVNIVRDVPRYDESASGEIVRAQPIKVWYRLLARIGKKPRKGRRPANRGKPQRLSKTKARLRVILWTGLPHTMLAALKPADVDLKGQRVKAQRRKKGTGTPGQWIPLVAPAIPALKRFAAANAWGKFSASAMHSMLAHAVAKENAWRARWKRPALPKIRPYDARHTFAAELSKVVHDDWMLDAFLVSKQRRYRLGAKQARMEQARDAFNESL